MNSNITLQQLIYIVAVDTHGSFVEAAEECKVSQPALSMQIRKLENTLGVTLFDRSRQPVRPTEIGRRIISQGRLVLREAGRIQETVDVAQGEMKGEYRIGAVRSLASWLLPSVLRAFSAEHPGVTVTVRELPMEELVDEIRRDQLDAGLVPLPVPVDTLADRPLFYEPFLAYVPRSHPLYEYERLSRDDLAGAHLLLPTRTDGLYEQGLGFLPANTIRGESVPIRWEGGTLDSLRRLAEEGVGVAVLPRLAADELRGTGTADMLREFAQDPPYRTIGLVYTGAHTKGHITDVLAATILSSVPRSMLEEPG